MYTDLSTDLEALTAAGLRRRPRHIDSLDGPWATVDGQRLLVMGSNNYLGLAAHPTVVAAAQEAEGRWGAGATGSRLTTGSFALHEELEAALAALKGSEAALLFTSGYLAATGTIPALAGRGDLILSDALNHACLIDGCRLSGAEVRIFRHADAEHVCELLTDRASFRRCLIVTDGVFSMDGDIAPLPDLHRLSREHNAWLMVDDAHATGVLGPNGGGTAEHFGLHPGDIIHMGTLSKALGTQGGFIAGPSVLIDYLQNRARSFIFDTALAPGATGAAIAALKIVRNEPERRMRLQTNSRMLREIVGANRSLRNRVPFVGSHPHPPPEGRGQERRVGNAASCFILPLSSGEGLGRGASVSFTPIIPIIVGESGAAVALAARLEERGIWAPAIRPPTVPPGTARLRVSVTAAHSEEDIRHAAQEIIEQWQ